MAVFSHRFGDAFQDVSAGGDDDPPAEGDEACAPLPENSVTAGQGEVERLDFPEQTACYVNTRDSPAKLIRKAGGIGGDSGVVGGAEIDVEADTDYGVGPFFFKEVGFDEYAADLTAVDKNVVGPFYTGFKAGYFFYTAGDGEGGEHDEGRERGSGGAEDKGEGEAAGGREPGPFEATPAGGLLSGDDGSAFRGAGAGFPAGEVHGGSHAGVVNNVPPDEAGAQVFGDKLCR